MVDTTELDDEGEDRMKSESSGPVAGGTVLGVHNLAIVFPQFVVSLILYHRQPFSSRPFLSERQRQLTSRRVVSFLLSSSHQVAIISSFIFKAVASAGRPGEQIPPPGNDDFLSGGGGGEGEESSGTAWVLRFGGLCALVSSTSLLSWFRFDRSEERGERREERES